MPSLPAWSRSASQNSDDNWNVSVPLRAGEKVVGELELWRALSKRRLLFQFSSLLDTLIPPFEKQLKKHYDGQEKELAEEHGLPSSPGLQAGILAGDGKG